MPKRLFSVFLLFIAITFPSVSLAQTPTVNYTSPTPQESSGKNNGMRYESTIKQAFEDRMDALKSRRVAVKDLLEQKKENHEKRKDALQLKLQNFKDIRRKNIVLNLDEKIASISSKRVDRMSEALEKLEGILTRITTKANEIAGCDKTQLDSAIAGAESAIEAASTAVEKQANTTYEFNIAAEDSAKTNVGATIKQLTQDLRSTHQKVMGAKQQVVKAAVELRKLKSCARITGNPTVQPTDSTASPSVTLTN